MPHHKTDAILRKENLDRYDDRDDIRVNLIPAKLIIEKDRVYIENGNRAHGNGIIDPENFSSFPKNPSFLKK